ncbi:MAG: hypothetical protein KAI17_11195 [Thiotrichaceae bacterium]|nr:hypothetical protein [Thiotrichaceae bacterium]
MGIIGTTKEKSEVLAQELIEKSDELIQELKVKSGNLVNEAKEKSSVMAHDVIAKSEEFLNDDKYDDKYADMVVMAATKQEAVNEILKKRGFDYLLGAIEIEMGIPPLITFKVIANIDDNSKTE